MNRKKVFAFFTAVLMMISFTVPTCAVDTRASDQLAVYDIYAKTVTDKIAVFVTVTGNGVMDKIGCESIDVYKLVGSDWVWTESKTEDDDNMSRTNFYTHADTVYCTGESGVHYKVVVTIFAENSKGRDTRSETFYLIGK